MSGGISEVFSTINQGRLYIEANGFGEKVKNKYATGNTLCTLSHHYHYQN
jgi:hypothetical protein